MKMRAKMYATIPATRPEQSGADELLFHILLSPQVRWSVAGEAEEVAGVVDEFVDVGVRSEHRHRALVVTEEVVGQRGDQHGEGEPQRGADGGDVGDGQCPALPGPSRSLRSCQMSFPGSCVPVSTYSTASHGALTSCAARSSGYFRRRHGSQWRDRPGLSPGFPCADFC